MRHVGPSGAGGRIHGRDRRLRRRRQGSGRAVAAPRSPTPGSRDASAFRTVVVNFDPDTAGANAARKVPSSCFSMRACMCGCSTLDGGLDPDEYVKQNGAEAYRARAGRRAAGISTGWPTARARKFDMRSSDGRMDAFKFLLPAVEKDPRQTGARRDRQRSRRVSGGRAGPGARTIQTRGGRAAGARTASAAPKPSGIPAIERMLLNALMSSEQARRGGAAAPRRLRHGRASPRSEIFDALRHLQRPVPMTFSAARRPAFTRTARDLLHQIVAADEMVDELQALEQARACLRRLESGFSEAPRRRAARSRQRRPSGKAEWKKRSASWRNS